jgi:hypothetical protein
MKNKILLISLLAFLSLSVFAQKADSKKIKEELKEWTEVKDIVLTDANVLYIAILDDGVKKDVYADYVCTFLKSKRIKVDMVKIVKYGSMKDPKRDNAYGVLLGKCFCE